MEEEKSVLLTLLQVAALQVKSEYFLLKGYTVVSTNCAQAGRTAIKLDFYSPNPSHKQFTAKHVYNLMSQYLGCFCSRMSYLDKTFLGLDQSVKENESDCETHGLKLLYSHWL